MGADNYYKTRTGAAYVFERISGLWTEVAKLTATDGEIGDWFGCSVAISGNYAIVGAPFDDDIAIGSGAAYIFKRVDSGLWIEVDKLTASNGAYLDQFGRSVSISGDYAIVGAPAPGNVGSRGWVYVFERDGDIWTEIDNIAASDPVVGDLFGAYSISISGDYIVVGAHWDDWSGTNTGGSAYVFERNGGSWSQIERLMASEGTPHIAFGFSVSISGDYIFVGAPLDNVAGLNSGSAYAYQISSGPVNEPDISVSPPGHDFGTVTTDSSSAPLEVTISNAGQGELVVSSISIADTDNFSLDFNAGSDSCGTSSPTIAPGESCTFTVTFNPSSSGTYDETLSINSNDPDTPNVGVSLTGLARQYFALLVGVSNPPNTKELEISDNDALDLRDALLAYPNWSLHPENVVVLTNKNAPRVNVLLEFQLLRNRMELEDVFLFMFSGHTDRRNDIEPEDEAPIDICKKPPCEAYCKKSSCDEYIVTYDEERGNFIRDDELADWLNSLPTSNIIAILGNCFSGDIIGDLERVPGIVVLTATDVNEEAAHLVKELGSHFKNSPFMWSVIECIKGLRDDDGLNSLSAEAVYDCANWVFDNNKYIREKLEKHKHQQNPQLLDDYPAGQGATAEQTIIIKNP